MSLSHGLLLLIATLIVAAILLTVTLYLREKEKYLILEQILAWIFTFLPAIFLFLIRKWRWREDLDPATLAFNWFHFIWLGFLVLVSAFLIFFARRERFKKRTHGRFHNLDRFVFRFGVMLLTIEIVKQIYFANLFIGDYQYSLIPFQFCSVPMYVCLIAPMVKNRLLKTFLYDFLGLYMFIAGFAVMIFPTTVYVRQIYICFHTMLWHGGMVAVGLYIITYRRMGTNFKQWLRGGAVLLGFVLVAVMTNILIHYFGSPELQSFKAFFLDPFAPEGYRQIFILSDIYNTFIYQLHLPITVGFPLYLILYLLAFGIGSIIVFLIARLVIYLRHEKEDVNKFDLIEDEVMVKAK
ncbi:MAG: hypothetical protein ACOX3K_04700 [Bacilli bacterium]